MEKFLIPYDGKSDQPFLIYKQPISLYRSTYDLSKSLSLSKGKKFVCIDHVRFGQTLAKSTFLRKYKDYCYLIDWSSCRSHPLIFHLSIIIYETSENIIDIMMKYFHFNFLKVFEKHMPLSNFTILLTMPRNYSDSMHIHVLNVEISQDDYVHLCNLMKEECKYQNDYFAIYLKCPMNVFLISYNDIYSQKYFYVPVRLIQFEKYFCEDDSTWKLHEINKFPSLPSKIEFATFMSPLPKENAIFLNYPTRITPLKIYQRVNHFTSCVNGCKYTFIKENKLVRNDSRNESFCYQFLKHNANFIDSIVTFDFDILKTWHKNFSFKNARNTGIFQSIDDRLRKKCVHMKNEDSPLNTLLQSKYFLPVFYSLCNLKYTHYIEIKEKFKKISNYIRCHFQNSKIKPCFLPEKTTHLDFDTILYCAFKMFHNETKEPFHSIFKGMGWEWIFESIEDVEDIKKNIKVIQKRFFPIVKESKNNEIYSWDPTINTWINVNEKQIKEIIEEIYDMMKCFEGFSKIPKAVQSKLENTSWIDSILNDVLTEIKNINCFREIIAEKKHEVYGPNVPQYYFLNY